MKINLAPTAKKCSGALNYRISLNWYMRSDACLRNWHPATTTYQILAPRNKSKADILGQLWPEIGWLKLAHQYKEFAAGATFILQN